MFPFLTLPFRPLYAFVEIELAARRVVHVGVTRHPTDAWVAQQFREATPFGQHPKPKHLITDNDGTYGPLFAQVAKASGIDHIRTAYRAPLMKAICGCFLGSVRRECLDYLLIFSERHLERVLKQYMDDFNAERPHQGIRQCVPDDAGRLRPLGVGSGAVQARPVLGGLPHAYRRAA